MFVSLVARADRLPIGVMEFSNLLMGLNLVGFPFKWVSFTWSNSQDIQSSAFLLIKKIQILLPRPVYIPALIYWTVTKEAGFEGRP